MIDLSIISASFAHDRVADQFAGPAATPRVPARRPSAQALRAVPDRREPTPRGSRAPEAVA